MYIITGTPFFISFYDIYFKMKKLLHIFHAVWNISITVIGIHFAICEVQSDNSNPVSGVRNWKNGGKWAISSIWMEDWTRSKIVEKHKWLTIFADAFGFKSPSAHDHFIASFINFSFLYYINLLLLLQFVLIKFDT